MKKVFLLILVSLHYINLNAQEPPIKANLIIVHSVDLTEICTRLLDAGYMIAKKDNDLQTVRTEPRNYLNGWGMNYILNIRVKDSLAYISGIFDIPPIGSDYLHLHNEPIYNAKQKKSAETVAFGYMNTFALSFNKPVEYLVQ